MTKILDFVFIGAHLSVAVGNIQIKVTKNQKKAEPIPDENFVPCDFVFGKCGIITTQVFFVDTSHPPETRGEG